MNDFLADRARISPGKTALIFEGRSWTYDELNALVAGVCARLDADGIGLGMRVAVYLPNRPDYVVLVHSLLRLGAVIVPLNLRLTREEVKGLLNQANVDAIVADGKPEIVRGLVAEDSWIEAGRLFRDVEAGPADWQSRCLDLSCDWGIMFTSGTSGESKGAVLTAGNLYYSAVSSALRLGSYPEDRWLLGMPLYHVGGLSIVFRCAIYGTAVVLHDGFDPEALLKSMGEDRVTMVSLVPTMLRRMLEHHQFESIPGHLRLVLLGGAAAREELVETALAQGVNLALTYGLTEAASQVATTRVSGVRAKPLSVGRALFQIELRIAKAGSELPAQIGEAGEILIKGPTVMRGYLGQPDLAGWLHTGDIGYLDEDGDLFVLQRRTDLIVSGGENVYPVEIEKVLREHPAISDACVVGLPDEIWGQQVAALVVSTAADLSLNDIEGYLRKRLAGYKLPRTVVISEELPHTASGKVCRPDVITILEKSKLNGQNTQP